MTFIFLLVFSHMRFLMRGVMLPDIGRKSRKRWCGALQIAIATYATGSYPNPPPGRQRDIRLIARHKPRTHPYFSIAWAAYSLQLGTNLHAARPPNIGDMAD
jgi:hypothetical protein